MPNDPRPDEDHDVIVHFMREHEAGGGPYRDVWRVYLGKDEVGQADNEADAMIFARNTATRENRPAWSLSASGYPLKRIGPAASTLKLYEDDENPKRWLVKDEDGVFL